MTKEQEQVKEFMCLFKQEVQSAPVMPDTPTRALRAKLIFEEAIETINALGFSVINPHAEVGQERTVELVPDLVPDFVNIIDGIGDLHYVAYCGTGLACGVDMEPISAEIHRSNMTKRWTEADIKHVRELYPTGVVESFGNGLYRVLVGGKVIKSPSYQPARVKELIESQIL